jgi:hypothetical protein
VADFLALRIGLLQQRPHPAWEFTGPRDPTCLWLGKDSSLAVNVLARLVSEICNSRAANPLPPGVFPLYNNTKRNEILASMPKCDEWGI